MTHVTPELQDAWDRILHLDTEVTHWKRRYHDLEAKTVDLRLQVKRVATGLVDLVNG